MFVMLNLMYNFIYVSYSKRRIEKSLFRKELDNISEMILEDRMVKRFLKNGG